MANDPKETTDGVFAVEPLTELETYVIVSALGAFVQNVLGPSLVNAIQRQDAVGQQLWTEMASAATATANRLRPKVADGPTDKRVHEVAEGSKRRIIVPDSRIVVPGEEA